MKKIILSVVLVLSTLLLVSRDSSIFYLGGFLIQAGINIQDFSNFGHSEEGRELSTEELYKSVIQTNKESSQLNSFSSRKARHPDVLIIMCIDPRLDDNRILGDSRDYYDVIRVPGSVITDEVIESVKLSVLKHNVKLVIVTTHTDCAMERLAKTEEGKINFPVLAKGVEEERLGIAHLSEDKVLNEKIKTGDLQIVHQRIDTRSGKFLE